MKQSSFNVRSRARNEGFTLVELMVAMSVGILIAGTVVLLLVQAGTEERNGYSDATVEARAYTLEANITSVIRGSSAGLGITFNASSKVLIGTNIAGYNSIYIFRPNTNGTSYTTAQITANPTNGSVIYIPDVSHPANTVSWMANGTGVVLRQLYFLNTLNLDQSVNNSLINVTFQMDDNGYSHQNANNNIPSINRSFSVQMRCD